MEYGWILARVHVGDRAQRGLIGGHRSRARERERAGAGVVAAGDPALIGKPEHVLAARKITGDRHAASDEIRAVDVGDCDAAVDRRRGLIFRIGEAPRGRHDDRRRGGDRGRVVQRDVARLCAETVHGDAINGSRDRVERDAALQAAARVVIAPDHGQGIDRRSGIDREQRVEVGSQRIEGRRTALGRCPAIPHGPSASVPSMVGFPGFFRRVFVEAGDSACAAGKHLRVGEIVVPRDERVGQQDVARGAAEPVHGNAISRASDGIESDAALRAAAEVVVADYLRQGVDCRSRIDRQDGVEVGRKRVEGRRAGERRGPLIPDRSSARVPGVIGLAGFLRGADVGARDAARRSGEILGIGEVVIGRDQREVEGDVARRARKSVHGNVINRAGNGVEGDAALRAAAGVVVASDFRQGIHGAAGIDRQQRVEGGREGVEGRHPVCRSSPLIPN